MTETQDAGHAGVETPQPAPYGATSDVSAFKQRAAGAPLQLPSGLTVRARRVNLQTFVRQGNVPNALMEVVESAISKGQEIDLEKMVDPDNLDLSSLTEMYDLIEIVVQTVVIEPKIHPTPTNRADIEDDKVYIHEVDDEDKMFLFQWASGGTSDVAQFRKEATDAMAFVSQVQDGGAAAKHAAGN